MKKLLLFGSIILLFCADTLAKPFQVVTYNTALARVFGHDFVPCVLGRLEAQKKNVWIKSEVPTVFLFQEVFFVDAYSDLKDWAQKNGFYVTTSDSLRNGLVVVSEFPIKKEELHVFSCNAFAQNRGVLDVTIDVDGREVRILDTHTHDSLGDEPNGCQIQQLKEVSQVANQSVSIIPVPSVLSGDFNAGPDLKIIDQQFDPVEKMWSSFFAEMNIDWRRAPSEKKGLTWNTDQNPIARPGPQINSTIDHIFVNESLRILDFELMYQSPAVIPNCSEFEVEPGKTFMSDHFGLKAKVELLN